MLKYTKGNLKKLENLFKAIGYRIIYEKGQFKSGYCIVNDQNMIVINKFYKTDARINSLVEIINTIDADRTTLTEEELNLLEQCQKK